MNLASESFDWKFRNNDSELEKNSINMPLLFMKKKLKKECSWRGDEFNFDRKIGAAATTGQFQVNQFKSMHLSVFATLNVPYQQKDYDHAQ